MKTLCLRLLLLLAAEILCVGPGLSPAQQSPVKQPLPEASRLAPLAPLDASAFPGSDICAQTNAAVAAAFLAMKQPGIVGMANLRGRVTIPEGNYVCKTPIHLPHGVWISGEGDATFLNWAGSGPAVIASDVEAPGEYVQGVLSDLHIRGAQNDGQEGIYVGGDSACQKTCTANPAANVGYDYVFRNITVLNIGGNGIRYGNSAFNLLWDNVHSNNNRGYGLYVPHTATGGGQFNTWTHSQLAGNALGGWWIDQLPFVTFEMFGLDVQYNAAPDGTSAHAEGTGGHVICVGCHFEHQQGVFLSLNSEEQVYKSDDIQLVGGQLITVKTGVKDPYLVLADGPARFTSTGTYIAAFHDIAEMVSVKQPSQASVSVLASSIFSVGVRFGGVTAARGQGIRYEQPIDTATQERNVSGPRYFGGLTSFDAVEADSVRARNGFSGTCTGGIVVTAGVVTGCKATASGTR